MTWSPCMQCFEFSISFSGDIYVYTYAYNLSLESAPLWCAALRTSQGLMSRHHCWQRLYAEYTCSSASTCHAWRVGSVCPDFSLYIAHIYVYKELEHIYVRYAWPHLEWVSASLRFLGQRSQARSVSGKQRACVHICRCIPTKISPPNTLVQICASRTISTLFTL